jgi:TRAP-type C4-dicarboxylate transport system permease small subunit
MGTIAPLRSLMQRLLELVVMILLTAMALLVVVAVIFRSAGASLVWYDEIASIALTWITYYGAALAALKRSHIGVAELVRAAPPRARIVMLITAEACVVGFFLALAWLGWEVFEVLEGARLISLPGVSVQWTQSVIPIGAVLFVVAQLLSLPEAWRRTLAPSPPDAAADGALQ